MLINPGVSTKAKDNYPQDYEFILIITMNFLNIPSPFVTESFIYLPVCRHTQQLVCKIPTVTWMVKERRTVSKDTFHEFSWSFTFDFLSKLK